MHIFTSGKRSGTSSGWKLALALVAVSQCTTGPRIEFAGKWVSTLPNGVGITFFVDQSGSTVTGTASNCGPATGSVTGSVTAAEQLSLHFDFSPDLPAPADSLWSFQGAFASATTIEGSGASSNGVTGSMTITRASGGPCI